MIWRILKTLLIFFQGKVMLYNYPTQGCRKLTFQITSKKMACFLILIYCIIIMHEAFCIVKHTLADCLIAMLCINAKVFPPMNQFYAPNFTINKS